MTRTPCTWMYSTTRRSRDSQSLDSDVLANKKGASTRSAISVPQGCGVIQTEFSVGTAQAKSVCLLLVSNIPAFARATPYRTCAEGVVRPIGGTKQRPKRQVDCA